MSGLPSGQSPSSTVYTGRKTKTGNSEALRFEQALFRSHPEFSDQVVAQVIAPGCMLVLARGGSKLQDTEEDDPIISAFLSFLEKDMPNHLSELDAALMNRIDHLVGNLEVDPHEDLGEESLL